MRDWDTLGHVWGGDNKACGDKSIEGSLTAEYAKLIGKSYFLPVVKMVLELNNKAGLKFPNVVINQPSHCCKMTIGATKKP